MKEAYSNPTYGDTQYGEDLKNGSVTPWNTFQYPVAVATETAYEYAINSDNPSPGGDPTVITDADLLSIIQANWPGMQQEVEPAT